MVTNVFGPEAIVWYVDEAGIKNTRSAVQREMRLEEAAVQGAIPCRMLVWRPDTYMYMYIYRMGGWKLSEKSSTLVEVRLEIYSGYQVLLVLGTINTEDSTPFDPTI